MARSATDFAKHNAQRTVQATNYGMSWLREIADQTLSQSKAAADLWLTVTRKAVEALDQQASAIRQQSMVVAEETLSNTFDFLHRLSRMKIRMSSRRLRANSSVGRLRSSATKPRNSGRPS